MPYNASDAYLESRVLSADGIELVRMLYQSAITAVRDARRHLAANEIAARSRAIGKVHRIVTELAVSLDHERGGELSRGLARLYDYVSRRLLEANSQQTDQPLEEVLRLLSTVQEGWNGIGSASPVETHHENRWAEPMPQAPPPDPVAYESHAWSF